MRRRPDPADLLIGLMFLAALVSVAAALAQDGCRAQQSETDQRECRSRGGTVDYFDAAHPDNWRCTEAH